MAGAVRGGLVILMSVVLALAACDGEGSLCAEDLCRSDCVIAGYTGGECTTGQCQCTIDRDAGPEGDAETEGDADHGRPDAGADADADLDADVDGDLDDDAPPCEPSCEGRVCGLDPVCGTLPCGECGENAACTSEGQCECRFDPCAGACCGEGETCTHAGVCCRAVCDDRECGADRCGGTCAPGCEAPDVCDEVVGLCCTPDCSGRECGDDGCGGSCGTCPAHAGCGADGACACEPGSYPDRTFTGCVAPGDPCGDAVTTGGHCLDDVWVFCDATGVIQVYYCWMDEASCLVDGGAGGCDCGVIGAGGRCSGGFFLTCQSGALSVEDCRTTTGRTDGFCSTFVQDGSIGCYCATCQRYNRSTGACDDLNAACPWGLICTYSMGYHYCDVDPWG